jgi:site-specific recombinase XerC
MRFSTRSAQPVHKNHTVMPSTSLSGGIIASNRVFHSTELLSFATRFFLEQKNLAPCTINVRMAAVRRLAYEASDTGLLNPDLAAGIRRVKGAKHLGVRIGNWLTIDQSRTLLGKPSDRLRGKRDRAILALLIGCGLRRAELVGLRTGDFQIREEHCVSADLVGKGKHIRTVPVPLWAKRAVDEWTGATAITGGTIFRRVSRLCRKKRFLAVWYTKCPQI